MNIGEGAPSSTVSVVNVQDSTGSGNPQGDLFAPPAGQVWQLMGMSLATFNATSVKVTLSNTLGIDVIIGDAALANSSIRMTNPMPVFVTAGMKLRYFITGATGNCFMRAAMIRIR